MATLNAVRFRVKPGRDEDFIELHRAMKEPFPGMRRAWLIKTGDRTYCMVGVWKDHQSMVDARPAMIANLDKARTMLEDLGGGLGVTDPVSGDSVVEFGGKDKEGKGGKKDKEKKGKKAGAAGGAMAGGGGKAAAGGGEPGGKGKKPAGGPGTSRAERKAARQARKSKQ